MSTRRQFLGNSAASLSLAAFAPLASSADLPATSTADALVFDAADFTLLEKTIETDAGSRTVSYRFYKARPYVARPVDVTYQSLTVSVPLAIDGKTIDVSASPIMLVNSVGGYFPSSVAEATGVGEGKMAMPAGMGGPPKPPKDGAAATFSNAMMARGKKVNIAEQAIAAGLVVVEPGARGRTLQDAAGNYYGVAPAAIVDLKAAVRYLRHNAGRLPGNTERIISTGTSAGGALSALLGASGDSAVYLPYLQSAGAAPASDGIYAAGCWCPITDLEHADMAYEWNWGPNTPQEKGNIDPALSAELADMFLAYQASLGLPNTNGLDDHIVTTLLQPAADQFLTALSDADRKTYLAAHPNIRFENGKSAFTWDGFKAHVGTRKKGLPAFDAFDLTSGENNLFGKGKTKARHFTTYSLRKATNNPAAELEPDLAEVVPIMNPMPFLLQNNPGAAPHWWLRTGTSDTDTAHSILSNLASSAEKAGRNVSAKMYWDAGHGANEDISDFLNWVSAIAAAKG